MKRAITFLFILFLSHRGQANLPPMPEPVSNNAIARVSTTEGDWIISFMGLGAGKSWQDVHNKVWALKLNENENWQIKKPVPSSLVLKGRLAAVAVGIADKAYLFGGYTVAEDHSEISSPDNFVYNIIKDDYQKIKAMPVAVDDAVALVYQNRYIYLVSGWHNDGNVNLTQVYDTQTDSWSQASPFLGRPVFGQAGGIVGNNLLVCDGVKVVPLPDRRRTFQAETACYRGSIQPENHLKIDWRSVPHPTGTARYRMAATGISTDGIDGVLLVGGSDTPYNYNGIGYNGNPSGPDPAIWFYRFSDSKWSLLPNSTPSMDHRGLLETEHNFVIPGGMLRKQTVTNRVTTIDKWQLLTSIKNNINQNSQQ